MDETEIKRLRNVYRLTESPIEGEADAALAMTKKLRSGHGLKMSDLPAILAGRSNDRRPGNWLVEPGDWSVEEEHFWAAKSAAFWAAKDAEALALRRKEDAGAAARWAERRREAAKAKAAALAKATSANEFKQRSDDKIRLRLQVQEEAVAAGFEPKDVPLFVRTKLASIILCAV